MKPKDLIPFLEAGDRSREDLEQRDELPEGALNYVREVIFDNSPDATHFDPQSQLDAMRSVDQIRSQFGTGMSSTELGNSGIIRR